jgi:hypothetical protein
MPTIRIDDDVFKALQRKATPFVDTPNDVLLRLLGLTKDSSRSPLQSRSGSRRRGSDSYTLQGAFRRPILEALNRLGGSARMAQVLDDLRARMQLKSPGDFESTRSGAVLWENRAQRERLKMVKEGLLRADSPHGVWELTESGRQYLAS